MESRQISDLPGIGEKRAQAFAKAGLYTMADLLHYFPVPIRTGAMYGACPRSGPLVSTEKR